MTLDNNQQNDPQHNDVQQNDSIMMFSNNKQNDSRIVTLCKMTAQWNSEAWQHNDTQRNDIQQNDSIMTHSNNQQNDSIITINNNDTQNNDV